MKSDHNPRDDLMAIYRHAIEAVDGRRCVGAYLAAHRPEPPVYLVAVGKAASAMAQGARAALGRHVERALVITKYDHLDPLLLGAFPTAVLIEAGHPVPDANSLKAGRLLLDLIDDAPPQATFVFLISGGASALVEVPPEGVGLEDLRRAHSWLMGSGLPIGVVNGVRKSLSCIKGGRLLDRLRDRDLWQLLISDVPGDDPAIIGSGLLVPDRGSTRVELPDWLEAMRVAPPAGAGSARVHTRILASSSDARGAALERARSLGYTVFDHEETITGDAVETGRSMAALLGSEAPGLHVWGGETVVRLPAHPGRGGRCQSLALAAATRFAGRPDLFLLAAGTDGGDGPGPAAGAVVDGGTIGRGAACGLSAERCIVGADAGSFLEAAGDLIHTGPTGSNVMDLMLGLRVSGGA